MSAVAGRFRSVLSARLGWALPDGDEAQLERELARRAQARGRHARRPRTRAAQGFTVGSTTAPVVGSISTVRTGPVNLRRALTSHQSPTAPMTARTVTGA